VSRSVWIAIKFESIDAIVAGNISHISSSTVNGYSPAMPSEKYSTSMKLELMPNGEIKGDFRDRYSLDPIHTYKTGTFIVRKMEE